MDCKALSDLAGLKTERPRSLNTACKRRLSKVLPLEEQPDMATTSLLGQSGCVDLYKSSDLVHDGMKSVIAKRGVVDSVPSDCTIFSDCKTNGTCDDGKN